MVVALPVGFVFRVGAVDFRVNAESFFRVNAVMFLE